jgi:hypothetical protein
VEYEGAISLKPLSASIGENPRPILVENTLLPLSDTELRSNADQLLHGMSEVRRIKFQYPNGEELRKNKNPTSL